jgi:peptidoglycan glycosyltransferase
MVEFDFPQGTLAAHVLGVRSGGIAARISSTAYLTSAVNPIFNLLGIPETVGESQLTIDTRLQAAAEAEIADSTGAVVVLDAKTGAVLAEASNPIYDPSKQYTEDEEGALPEGTFINRAINAHYPPGSTFKMVTAAAGLERGIATPETQLNGNAFVLSNGQRVVNINGIEYGQISLETALKCSSNTAFADLALKVGDDALMEQAEGFGFNKDPDDRVLHTLMSKYGLTQSDFTLAWAAVGQPTSANESVCGPQATVMQMAVVLATIENDGILVKPYILTSEQPKTGFFGGQDRALREGTAQTLHDMLVTSSHVSESRVPVAGKTGTAETGSTNVCWYVCEADGCVVACCIEGTFEYGSTLAMPKALRVLDAAVGLGSYQIN